MMSCPATVTIRSALRTTSSSTGEDPHAQKGGASRKLCGAYGRTPLSTAEVYPPAVSRLVIDLDYETVGRNGSMLMVTASGTAVGVGASQTEGWVTAGAGAAARARLLAPGPAFQEVT
jgi:hypothetical protein